ncbi:two-component system, sensor histidine kinase [Burkholderiaceae bacterium]|nr:two-component system, sensor histidine kinase [Burkholderiaceae bacterium]
MNETVTEFKPVDRSAHELLVVDDDPASRYATARLLRSAGFRTREAATGAEGLRAADDSISVMVLDVHLPDIDGFELCRMLRSRPETARLPVLHLSAAYVTDDDKVRGLDSGADAYLTHPVEPAVLVATVQALVRTRAAEDAMRRSEAKFRAIYTQAPGGICLLDLEGRFIDANPAMLGLLGRELRDVVGRPVSAFVPEDWVQRVDQYTRHAGLIAISREFPLLDPVGGTVHLEWNVSPHIEPNVNMAVAIDISQRVLLEQQRQQLLERERVARSAAERMNRMKDDLIAVLSHELRTPLNAIMGWTHVLQKRGGNAETLQGLAAIERNGHIQARMISDILDMSRLNLGKMPLALDLVDPAEVVSSAINAMRSSFDERGHQVVVHMTPPYQPIRADSSRLQQVLWNLLSNAIKFSPAGARIDVRVQQDERALRISVADQGQGIAEEFLPFLFDRFTQSDAASNRLRGGLGLGLSIVKHLVEAHGGSVSAHSEGPGRGTTIEVTLPADGASAPDAQSDPDTVLDELEMPEEGEHSLDGLRLLIVDDDKEACAMLQIILADHGALVTAAHDVDQALATLDPQAIDVIVSDVGMPGKDGYELIREIRRREMATQSPRTPAIALTSFTRAQDEEQAINAGFDAHCPKPLRPLQFIQQIRRVAGRPGFRQSR